ncbi:MAG: DUF4278 domain-containing protein [Alkalinema sp. RL_2_19]|nr:DUF4278 domain-containing protein [Alkalinema sp. RL_2_19]
MFTSIHIRGEIMQFIYRGVKYDNQSTTQQVRGGEVTGKYRGQVWQRHLSAQKTTAQMPVRHLKYRGATV